MRVTKRVRVVLASLAAVSVVAAAGCGGETAPQPAGSTKAVPSPNAQSPATNAPAATATPSPGPSPQAAIPGATGAPTVEQPTAKATPGPTPPPTTAPATGKPPLMPIEPPDDTSTVLARRVEAIDGGITGLRFYESPDSTQPLDSRVYRTTFGPDTARYIGWEIGLAFPAQGKATQLDIESEVRDAGGALVAGGPLRPTLQPDWISTQQGSTFGAGSSGFWGPGWYSVTVNIDGEEAARGWFQVAPPPTAESSSVVRHLLETQPQPETPSYQADRRLAEALSRLWDAAPGLAQEVERFPWIAGGVTATEQGALEHLAEIAMASALAAESAKSWTWLTNGISQDEWDALRDLAVLGQTSPDSLAAVAGFQWLADGVSTGELAVLGYLGSLARESADGPAAPVGWPWVADGITTTERWGLQALSRLASVDPDLGTAALAFPWVSDDMQDGERWALRGLSGMTDASTALARRAEGYPWLADGINEDEWRTLDTLADLSGTRLSLASQVAGYSWLDDDLTGDERWAVWSLAAIEEKDADLAVRLGSMAFMEPPFRARDYYALSSIRELRDLPKEWGLLSSQAWFADGLNDEDAAFVATLADLNSRAPSQYSDLVASHYARTSVIDLPLAGYVEMVAFRRTPFQTNDDAILQMQNALRALESFMGVPFPKTDVILLFTDKLYSGPAINDIIVALNVGTHMLVTRPELIEGDFRSAMAHETAHFYWNSKNAPLWFREGGADFLASYVLDWSGIRSLADRNAPLWNNDVQGVCAARGVPDVQTLITLLDEQGYAAHSGSSQFLCNYIMGEYLLLELYDTLGEQGASAAWRDLYLLAETESRALTEQEIFDAFSRNTPDGQEQAFLSVYRRWHGGPAGG